MKTIFSAVLAVFLLTGSSAYATIARLAVMGTQPSFGVFSSTDALRRNVANGALWYEDDYNVFYNPAHINTYANSVVVNKGAEGGWFFKLGENLTFGAYLNRGSSTPGFDSVTGMVNPGVANTISSGTLPAFGTHRPIDVFVGGDYGIKWGLMISNALRRDESLASAANPGNGSKAAYWHVNAGVQVIGLDLFGGATFLSQYENSTNGVGTTERLQEYNGGIRYNYEAFLGYAVYEHSRQSIGSTVSTNIAGLGVGHDTKVADGVHFYKNFGFYFNHGSDDRSATVPGNQYQQFILPLNLAIEAEATSWLVLRCGAAYDLWNETKFDSIGGTAGGTASPPRDRHRSDAGTQTFRIGSTFKFGRFSLDSALGNGTAPGGSASPGGLDTRSAGFDSQFFALIAAKYRM